MTFFQFRWLRFSRRRRIRWRTASGSPFLYTGCRCLCLKTSVSTISERSKAFWPHIALFRSMFYVVRSCLNALSHFRAGMSSKSQAFCFTGKHETGVKGGKILRLLIENKLILTKRLKYLSYAICAISISASHWKGHVWVLPVCKYFSPAAAFQITPMECVSLQLFQAQTSRFSLTSMPPTRKTARSSQMTCGSPSQRCRRWRSTE